jgi:hypothetical protein
MKPPRIATSCNKRSLQMSNNTQKTKVLTPEERDIIGWALHVPDMTQAKHPPKAISRSRTETGELILQVPPAGSTIDYHHSYLCQTSLPYRPTDALTWEREQGTISLSIEAGRVRQGDARQGRKWVQLPLPHGEKPRLLLIHLNSEAIRTGSPVVDVEATMTAFARAVGLDTNGPALRDFKDQLSRLSAATVRFEVNDHDHVVQLNSQIISGFDLWWPKGDHDRVAWPSLLRLSPEYFASLQRHAVPLDERAIMALKGSSLALDVYTWLAQRLHRIKHPSPSQSISWLKLKEQFGPDYSRARDFRVRFTPVLATVLAVYPTARVEVTDLGVTLFRSPPPVSKRAVRGAKELIGTAKSATKGIAKTGG